ncbi:hypothetical protein [Frigidibacter sp. SD6-1]|uniref:hypothetical protein n=1 Tax=Frigidibacter sp. SD6-1 TaxID=3032581 RepID=UPI0024DFEA7E|nr:hypothetical protein [Frigidibacter sp. SD6-1]
MFFAAILFTMGTNARAWMSDTAFDRQMRLDLNQALATLGEGDLRVQKDDATITWRFTWLDWNHFAHSIRVEEQPGGAGKVTMRELDDDYQRAYLQALSWAYECGKQPAVQGWPTESIAASNDIHANIICTTVPRTRAAEPTTETFQASVEDLDRLHTMVSSAHLCDDPPVMSTDVISFDGTTWFIEQSGKGEYCSAWLNSPDRGAFRRLGFAIALLTAGSFTPF